MADTEQEHPTGTEPEGSDALIAIPARACREIKQLGFYLDQMVNNLQQVNGQLRGSANSIPGVLSQLKEITRMTEAATFKVLDQAEALGRDGRHVSELITKAAAASAAGGTETVIAHLGDAQGLVAGFSDRALEIISALEFQDLTAQKLQWAFEVLAEVASRLEQIHLLVDVAQPVHTGMPPPPQIASSPEEAKAGQDLVDDLLKGFSS